MDKFSDAQGQFNNKKYIKGYKDWNNNYGKSFEINQTQLRLGDRVEIDINESNHGGKLGHIIPKFDKDNKDAIGVRLEEDGKEVVVDKTFLTKIAEEFAPTKSKTKKKK
jgi:hypothetical protein